MIGRKRKKLLKLTTFQKIRRGTWIFQFSTTDQNSIMIVCTNAIDNANSFIKFFNIEEEAVSFVDFLVANPEYKLDEI